MSGDAELAAGLTERLERLAEAEKYWRENPSSDGAWAAYEGWKCSAADWLQAHGRAILSALRRPEPAERGEGS